MAAHDVEQKLMKRGLQLEKLVGVGFERREPRNCIVVLMAGKVQRRMLVVRGQASHRHLLAGCQPNRGRAVGLVGNCARRAVRQNKNDKGTAVRPLRHDGLHALDPELVIRVRLLGLVKGEDRPGQLPPLVDIAQPQVANAADPFTERFFRVPQPIRPAYSDHPELWRGPANMIFEKSQ